MPDSQNSRRTGGTFGMSGSLSSVKMRPNYSVRHVRYGFLLARRSAEIEKNHESESTSIEGEILCEYEAYVVGAILATVAFVELMINEIFADAFEGSDQISASLKPESLLALGALNQYQDKFSILEKYQLALKLNGSVKFELGHQPYQHMNLVIKLRNYLSHYHPEWYSSGQDVAEMNNLAKSLWGKYKINPFCATGNPFLPDKCISYGCAKWALETAIKFTDEFHRRMGIQPKYGSIRTHLILPQ